MAQMKNDGLRVLVTIASAVIVVAGLRLGGSLILPVVLATFLAVASYPITHFLRSKCRFPHWLAVAFTVIADFSFLIGLCFLTNYLAEDLITVWQTKYNPILMQKIVDAQLFLQEHKWDKEAREIMASLMDFASGQHLVNITTTIMSKAASILTMTTLVLILMTFLLGEGVRFGDNVLRISQKHGEGIKRFAKALTGIQKYLVIKTLISLLTGVLAWGLCAIVGVDLPLLWGIVAFALNFIPTLGSIVAAIPPILLALLMLGIPEASIVAVGYLAINTALGNLLEPLLLGRQFGIATSVVLLSVIFWGWVWGPIGMLLAVPISILVKLALESSHDLSWLAMLVDNPPKQKGLPILGLSPKEEDETQETSPK